MYLVALAAGSAALSALAVALNRSLWRHTPTSCHHCNGGRPGTVEVCAMWCTR